MLENPQNHISGVDRCGYRQKNVPVPGGDFGREPGNMRHIRIGTGRTVGCGHI
jgi:hypothetical protein